MTSPTLVNRAAFPVASVYPLPPSGPAKRITMKSSANTAGHTKSTRTRARHVFMEDRFRKIILDQRKYSRNAGSARRSRREDRLAGERFLVDLDDRHQQRKDERSDHEADEPERLQAAEDREEQRNRGKLRLPLHRPRTHDVVDERDRQHAPDHEEDDLPPLRLPHRSGDHQIDRRRHPHRGRADHRDQRKQRRDRAPESGARHARDREADAGHETLREAGEELAAEGRLDDVPEALAELIVVTLRQRRENRQLRENRLAFDVEEVHRQQHQREAEHEARQSADDRAAMPRDEARDLPHRRQQDALRAERGGIEVGCDAFDEREVPREIDALEHRLRLAGLQFLDDHVGLLHEQDGEDERGNDDDDRDAEEHHQRGAVRTALQPHAEALEQAEGEDDEDRAQQDRRHERPEDAKGGVEQQQREEAEEDDAGDAP